MKDERNEQAKRIGLVSLVVDVAIIFCSHFCALHREHARLSKGSLASLAHLPHQHTVGHVLDLRFGGGDILETDRVSNFSSESATVLLGDALGNRHSCDTTRLRAANHSLLCHSHFGKVLGHLGGFSTSRFSDHHQNLFKLGVCVG